MPRVVVATHHGVVIALNYFRSLIVFVQFLNVRGIADEETFIIIIIIIITSTSDLQPSTAVSNPSPGKSVLNKFKP